MGPVLPDWPHTHFAGRTRAASSGPGPSEGALAPPLGLPSHPVFSVLGRVEEGKIDRQHDDDRADESEKKDADFFE